MATQEQTSRDYVKIPGYNFVYKNGEQKRVGGVGAYLKEERDFKTHGHLNRLDTTIEQLWLEIKGENKKFILIASSLTQSINRRKNGMV